MSRAFSAGNRAWGDEPRSNALGCNEGYNGDPPSNVNKLNLRGSDRFQIHRASPRALPCL